jgi:hypothetical protein
LAASTASSELGGLEPTAAETTAPIREATVADLDRLESLTLEDFAVDFSKVKLPERAEGERLAPEELQAAVESFLETLRER